MTDENILAIEKAIGYTFKDKELLTRAFTHTSVTRDAQKNYESLEFLGDSILNFIVAKRLFEEFPKAHEGELTQKRIELVSQEPLDELVRKLDIAQYMIVGKGESAGFITSHSKAISDLFESIVAAVYLDSDIDVVEELIFRLIGANLNGEARRDYKSELNVFAAKHELCLSYAVVSQTGESHDPEFTIEVRIDGVAAGRGVGKTKKSAQQQAAMMALKHIEG